MRNRVVTAKQVPKSGRPEPAETPAERIRETARSLFYRQGFGETGINQIIAEAGASKKSFYAHYPSKDDLGEAYLTEQGRYYLKFFRSLGERYSRFEDFARVWAYTLRKEIAYDRYRGCPFANFAAQSLAQQSRFQPGLKKLVLDLEHFLREYLGRCTFRGRRIRREHVKGAAAHMLLSYEGAVQLWLMTGEIRYIDYMQENLERNAAAWIV